MKMAVLILFGTPSAASRARLQAENPEMLRAIPTTALTRTLLS
jgi:hypothetical protein